MACVTPMRPLKVETFSWVPRSPRVTRRLGKHHATPVPVKCQISGRSGRMGTARLFCEEGARGLQNTAQVVERPMFRVCFVAGGRQRRRRPDRLRGEAQLEGRRVPTEHDADYGVQTASSAEP